MTYPQPPDPQRTDPPRTDPERPDPQRPDGSPGQIGRPPTVPGQFGGPPTVPGQSGGQNPQYPAPGGQYPSGPGGQYPSGPGGQYPSGPGGQYPSGPGGQYPSGPGGQYPNSPGGPNPNGPGGPYPNGPYPTGAQAAPPPQYPPTPYQPPAQRPAAPYPAQFQAAQNPAAQNPAAQNPAAQNQPGPYQSAQTPPAQYQPGARAAPPVAPAQGAPYPGGPAAPQPAPPIPAAAPPPVAAPPQPGTYTMTRAAAQATAVTGSAATLVGPGQAAEAIAIPDTGVRRPPGSAPDGRRPGPGRGTRALTGRLARLRIGSHTVSRSALAQIKVGAVGAGLILGADRHHAPVSVRIFRPEPTRVTLVGGPWAGRLMAFRAFAVGARIAVITAEPQAWQEFGFRATGQPDRVIVVGAQQPLAMAATAQQPILVIDEFGTTGGTSPQALGPWQTQLTIVRQLDPAGVALVQDCDLVMLQRLRVEEASVASKALRLPGASTQFLQVMADDMVALVADGADRYISFAQTDVEREHTGGAHR